MLKGELVSVEVPRADWEIVEELLKQESLSEGTPHKNLRAALRSMKFIAKKKRGSRWWWKFLMSEGDLKTIEAVVESVMEAHLDESLTRLCARFLERFKKAKWST